MANEVRKVNTSKCKRPTAAQLGVSGILREEGLEPKEFTPGNGLVEANKAITEKAKKRILGEYPEATFE